MARDLQRETFLSEVASPRASAVGEFIAFLGDNKRWWLTPIVVILLLLGALAILGGSGAAPFIYTLF